AAQVHQAAFGQQEDCVPVRKHELVDLGLDVDLLDAGQRLQCVDLDLVVEVADVADDRLVLHRLHVRDGDDVLVASGGDIDVTAAQGVLDGGDLVAFHRRLQGADRVDLGHDDACAVGP